MKGIPKIEKFIFFTLSGFFDFGMGLFHYAYYAGYTGGYFINIEGIIGNLFCCYNVNFWYLIYAKFIEITLAFCFNYGFFGIQQALSILAFNGFFFLVNYIIKVSLFRRYFLYKNPKHIYWYLFYITLQFSIFHTLNAIENQFLLNQIKHFHFPLFFSSTTFLLNSHSSLFSLKSLKSISMLSFRELYVFFIYDFIFRINGVYRIMKDFIESKIPYTFNILLLCSIFVHFCTTGILSVFAAFFAIVYIMIFCVKSFCIIYSYWFKGYGGYSLKNFSKQWFLVELLSNLPVETRVIFSAIMISLDRIIQYRM